MKEYLTILISFIKSKAVISAGICAVAGASVAGAVTGTVYKHKIVDYESEITRLEAQQKDTDVSTESSPDEAVDTAVRVVDGILEVWNGSDWISYGSIDDVEAADPYLENDEKRRETEKSVAAKKLEELGLMINENGEIVPADTDNGKSSTSTPILVGNAIVKKTGNSSQNSSTGGNNTTSQQAASANASITPEQVMAAIQSGTATQTISSLPQSTSPSAGVTNVSWTAQPSSSGSSGGESSYSGGSSGGSSGGGAASYTTPTTTDTTGGTTSTEGSSGSSDSGGSSGGGGDSGGSSGGGGDSGGSSDSGSSDSGSSDSGSEGDGFSEDYK